VQALRAALIGLALGICNGCHDTRGPVVGVSPPRAPEHEAQAADAGAPERSPVDADFRAHMTKMGDRFLSVGHGQRFDAVLWVNAAAQAHWPEPASMPEGAVLVEDTMMTEAGVEHAGGLLVMVKGPASWRFVAVSPDGRVVSDARVVPCATCHRDAPGGVFSFNMSPSSASPK
jgi:hypothetical protein